jgi:hypothetical protein
MKKVNRNKRFWIIFLIFLILFIAAIISFRPISNPEEKDCSKITGTLMKYQYHSDFMDVQLKIDQNDKIYYINHMIDAQKIFPTLDSLIGKEIVIYAVDHWTLLDPKSRVRHIARITTGDGKRIIYTEY